MTKKEKEIQLQNDRDLIIKLRRVTRPIQSEMDEIYYLYKKYIDSNAQPYCQTCNGSGPNNISTYYWQVVGLQL